MILREWKIMLLHLFDQSKIVLKNVTVHNAISKIIKTLK